MSNSQNQNEESMQNFEDYINESTQDLVEGTKRKGIVCKIDSDKIVVDINYKTEGIIDLSEFEQTPEIGTELELFVIKSSGSNIRLSKKENNAKSDRDSFKQKEQEGTPVDVKVTEYVADKGFKGTIGKTEAFIPLKHIALKTKDVDFSQFVGKTYKAKILKVNDGKRVSVLCSPRDLILDEENKSKNEFFNKHNVGDKIKGTVKTIKDYGAFISLGGIDGFLHKNEMSWGRVNNPSKILKEGDEVEVQILEIDKPNYKVSVGMKQLQNDPWLEVSKKYPIGSTVKGAVVSRKRAGYVIEIEPGIDGFVPNEETSWLKSVKTTLNIKDIIEGKVIDFDNDRKRVYISVKDLQDNPWKALKEQNPEGSVVKGKIKNITDFGMFVDFGAFIDGLIRKGDISWNNEPADLNELYNVGDVVEAKILHIDENKERFSLGIKQLEANPWKEINKLLPQGKVVEAKISGISKQGLEIELPLNMKGTIAVADLDPARHTVDDYKEGETISAIVVKNDAREKVIVLSIKKYIQDSERREAKEYMKKMASTEDSGFGNIFKDKLGK